MKKHALMALVLSTSLGLPAAQAAGKPTQYVIALGAVVPEPASSVNNLIDETVNALKPGDILTIFTLTDQKVVGQIALPANRRINDRARENRYGEARDAIKAALTARAPLDPASPSRWPQGIAEIGKLIEPGIADRNVQLIVLDRALYHDPAEPKVSMRMGFPNGALIRATQALSPFGTAERKDRLSGVAVHFCHQEEPKDFVNDNHQREVERAVALFVTEQSGTLATFTNAAKLCQSRFFGGVTTGSIQPPVVPADETPAMVLVRPRVSERTPAPAAIPEQKPAAPVAPPEKKAEASLPAVAAPVAPAATIKPVELPNAGAQQPAPQINPAFQANSSGTTPVPHKLTPRQQPKRQARRPVKRRAATPAYEVICDPDTGTYRVVQRTRSY